MQDGSVTVDRRKRGPDVWCFRWREAGPGGRRIHRRIVLGTAEDLKSIASASKMVVGLRREINLNDIRMKRESITLADLSRHFQQRELLRGNSRIAYSTKKADEGYLKRWIEPRWGEYRLLEIRAVEVESWLKSLNRAPGTRCKIRNVMSLLFNHGRRHDLCDRNPIEWVRQGAKRRTAPDILTSNEVQGFARKSVLSRTDLGAVGRNHRPAEERVVRVEMERRGLPSQTDSCYALDRAERHWRLQNGKLAETCSGSRCLDRNAARVASPDTVSIARELGVREPGESRSLALFGPGDYAAPYPSGCAKTRHPKANRLAYFSAHLFDAASIYWRGAKDHAGVAASLDDSCDPRYIHSGGHDRKA